MIFNLTPRDHSLASTGTVGRTPALTLLTTGWSPPRSRPSTLLSPPAIESLSTISYFPLTSPATSLVAPPTSLSSPAPNSASTAFPSWPNRDMLAAHDHSSVARPTRPMRSFTTDVGAFAPTFAPTSAYAACASSHIPDEDLADLECWDASQRADAEVDLDAIVGISWSDVKAPSVIRPEEPRRRKLMFRPIADTRRQRSRNARVRR